MFSYAYYLRQIFFYKLRTKKKLHSLKLIILYALCFKYYSLCDKLLKYSIFIAYTDR